MSTAAHYSSSSNFSIMKLHVEKGHAEIVIHDPQGKVNKLSRQALMELHDHIAFLKANAAEIKTLLIYSGMPDMFVAGADIEDIQVMKTRAEALELVQKMQGIFQELAELPQVTVTAIDGPCLGGGLELALACKYRFASTNPKTQLGLPEVQLGIIPGAGGTQRLPRIIGLKEALAMITSGSRLKPHKAKKLGLVSDIIPSEYLIDRVRKMLRSGAYANFPHRDATLRSLIEISPLKKIIFYMARKMILKQTKGHYPAPMKAVDVVEQTFHRQIQDGLKIEADAFVDLAVSATSKNLISIFFGTEALKKERGVAAHEAPDFVPRKIERLGVIGAGIMGGGIAAVAAAKRCRVRMKDVSTDALLSGLKTASQLFQKDLSRRKIERHEFQSRSYSISPTLKWSGFEETTFVVEAVVERMDVKKTVLREIEAHVSDNCIVATNTSSLSVTEMAGGLKRPGNFLGMHFFNPVPKMPLVEVVRAEKTSPQAVVQTVAFAKQLGKQVIVVKDRPGFLINRILMPFLIECGHLKQDGYSISQIDKAALHFGMPMGPFRLLDEIGLDTGAKVADVIAAGYLHMKVLPVIREMVEKGYLGRKNSRGFYYYENGKAAGVRSEFQTNPKDAQPTTDQMLQDRLILPMVSEAIMALDEHIVNSAWELDLGLIYGIGFPPFRGGLLRWVSSVGEQKILERLYAVHQQTKGRILVPKSLEERARSNQPFVKIES